MMMPALRRLIDRLFPEGLGRAARELAYLNASVSLYDLERREREVTQGKFARF